MENNVVFVCAKPVEQAFHDDVVIKTWGNLLAQLKATERAEKAGDTIYFFLCHTRRG